MTLAIPSLWNNFVSRSLTLGNIAFRNAARIVALVLIVLGIGDCQHVSAARIESTSPMARQIYPSSSKLKVGATGFIARLISSDNRVEE